jgi:hypothetical protein
MVSETANALSLVTPASTRNGGKLTSHDTDNSIVRYMSAGPANIFSNDRCCQVINNVLTFVFVTQNLFQNLQKQ